MQFCIPTGWLRNYDDVQNCAVILLYLQAVCSLVGSLGALYTGVLAANLALALFGLVAVASGSQTLGRSYAALLALALITDFMWFILFTQEIRQMWKDSSYGNFTVLSLQLVFGMQATSFSLRLLSGFFWVQMYRLGAVDNSALYQPIDFEGRIATFGLTHDLASPSRQSVVSDDILGGSIYNPATYSSLFQFTNEPYFGIEVDKEDGVDNRHRHTVQT